MRLIDADKLPHDIEREDIDNAPTIEAVKVVRCKDCKWHVQNGCEYLNLWMMHMDDFFCAFGEVKSDE